MSVFFKEVKEQYRNYEKHMIYLLSKGNAIYEFCLSAAIEYADNKNELENLQLKEITRELKETTAILESLVSNKNNWK